MDLIAEKTSDSQLEEFLMAAPTFSETQIYRLIKWVRGMADLFIVATASYHQLPLVALNSKHFQRIKELEILTEP